MERAVPQEAAPHKPAPNPYPVKPSLGPLLIKYLSTTAPPPDVLPDDAVPEILPVPPATAVIVYVVLLAHVA